MSIQVHTLHIGAYMCIQMHVFFTFWLKSIVGKNYINRPRHWKTCLISLLQAQLLPIYAKILCSINSLKLHGTYFKISLKITHLAHPETKFLKSSMFFCYRCDCKIAEELITSIIIIPRLKTTIYTNSLLLHLYKELQGLIDIVLFITNFNVLT